MTLLVPQSQGISVPNPSPLTETYWEGCRQDELRFQRCTACGAANFKPVYMCRTCHSKALKWEVSSGQGVVYSWTVVHRPVTPAFQVPYAPAIVDLDEGFQILSAVVGCTADEVRVGLWVAVEFHPIGSGFKLPYFSPTGGSPHGRR